MFIAINDSQKNPNDVNAVEIEVDGKKIKGQAALDWFLENLDKIY